jgi:uncharacterized phage protein (TIGR01671 family)
MRAIKFRAWDSARGQMAPFTTDEEEGDVFRFGGYYWPLGAALESDQLQVMQFTGLTDKNGKDIYEGDVVKQFNGLTAECKWDRQFAGFVYDKEWMVDVESSHNSVEVIGNIHENPELLEN